MADKPDLVKWVPSDDAAKIIDPGTTKKTNGFLYLEKPAFQYMNYLLNRFSKWIRGLQGMYADVVVGSSSQVTSYDATHAINALTDGIVDAASRVLILAGTHQLTANLTLTSANLIFDSEGGAIIDLNGFNLTISGANCRGNLRFTNVGSNTVTINGSGTKIDLHDIDPSRVITATSSVLQISGATSALMINGSAVGTGKGSNITAQASINIGKVGRFFHIVGDTPIQQVSERTAGEYIDLLFENNSSMVHSANLYLPGAVTLYVKSNDIVQLVSEGSGSWRAIGQPPEFSTGDAKITWKAVADAGWIMANDGSIGNEFSAATTRANQDTRNLFYLMWQNISDTWVPVSGGRGASAQEDFDSNKRLTLPRALGRALAVAGLGSGLTNRAMGQYLGTETHILAITEIPSHTHLVGTSTNVSAFGGGAQGPGSAAVASSSAGSGQAHNNMPPESFLNMMIKL